MRLPGVAQGVHSVVGKDQTGRNPRVPNRGGPDLPAHGIVPKGSPLLGLPDDLTPALLVFPVESYLGQGDGLDIAIPPAPSRGSLGKAQGSGLKQKLQRLVTEVRKNSARLVRGDA